jgi:hypothetical protein
MDVLKRKEEYVASQFGPTKRDFEFVLPDYALLAGDRPTYSAILQFIANPSRGPDEEFQVEFSINGTKVYVYGPSEADFVRTFAVSFDHKLLIPGDNNTLTVRRTGGEATLGISNLFVWYLTNVAMSNVVQGKAAPKKRAAKRTSSPKRRTASHKASGGAAKRFR